MIGVLKHREVRRGMQREFPAFATGRLRRFMRGLEHIRRYAGQLRWIGYDMRERVRRIEQVVAEAGGNLREAFAYRHETCLLVVGQFGAAQSEVAQLIFDDALLCDRERFELA